MRLLNTIILFFFVSMLFQGCIGVLGPEDGIYINEILTSNNGVVAEPINQKEVDWIEIYNGYDFAISLSGYYLTDNIEDTNKWSFPKGTIIEPNGYLLLWADGLDTLLHTNFKLSKGGEEIALFSKDKELLDHVVYSSQEVNISYGRKWDGIDKWVYFNRPTPLFSNSDHKSYQRAIYSEEPVFSAEAGFYNENVSLSIFSPDTSAEIRYTLNGNIPTRNSNLYTDALIIDSTTVIRAISIGKNKLSSKIVTRTYFLNVDKDLPVVSIVADSIALWDTISGIYEKSIKGLGRFANFEFFEDKKPVINQGAKMSISGNVARFFGQKAILLEASEKFGNPTFDHRFFPEKRNYSFQSILLRAGGHPDKYNSMFRDGLVQHLAIDLNVEYMAYRPAIVYINGKYWGIYNLREKLNSNYFIDNFNLDNTRLNLLENSWAVANKGNNKHYISTREFVKECDKSNPLNYAHVATLIDIDNYINYNIAEIFASNIDWPNWNIKFWKPSKEYAKWRWILVDLDYGFGVGTGPDYDMIGYATSPIKTRATNPPNSTILFRKMLEFPEFKDEFIQRFAVTLNVIYNTERVLNTIEEFKEQRAKEMPLHIERWKDYLYKSPWGKFKIPTSMEKWDEEIEVMREFARLRPDFVRKNLVNKFHLNGIVTITTSSDGGRILINTIQLEEEKLEGIYFKDIPMKMEVIPNPGQKFLYWIINGQRNYSATLNFIPKANGSIRAIFDNSTQTELPCIIEKNTTLKTANSPYFTTGEVIIKKGTTLTIEKGVQLLMEKHKSILVQGKLICNGTFDEPVQIMPNPHTNSIEWGALCIDNSEVELNHVSLLKGTWYDDKEKYKATITSIKSNTSLNYVSVESNFFPFYSEHGTVKISNSKMSSPKTCDLINIKYAKSAIVENCELRGNDYPDTDAIDYDSIHDGVIRNNTIYGFFGFNSDAIDIGEASSDVLIEGNRIFNMTDKGVSIGQGSSAIIRNNLFYGCSMGVGIKDSSSFAYINKNTFYGNKFGVSIFEKNLNSGGGGAEVMNCIFYETRKKPVEIDDKSWVSIINSLSEEKELDGRKNIVGNPEFVDATNFNFSLTENSPARNSGTEKEIDMGAKINVPRNETPDIIINEINCSPLRNKGPVYWVELYNNSGMDVDLTGWTITNENHYIYPLPQKLVIKKNEYLVLSNNYNGFVWHYPKVINVRGILDDKIIDRGSELLLYDPYMNLVDFIDFRSLLLNPDDFSQTGTSLELKSTSLNNKDKSNWNRNTYKKGSPGVKNMVK